jgi:phosphoribosylglycinamide formyltransferase-1
MARKRVAVLISGRGSNMAALIEATQSPAYPAEIWLVVSNRPDAAGLDHARAAGIATTIVDHTSYGNDRVAFEQALQAVLESARIELVCLAGFMRLLTDGFVTAWTDRMINIHPSLLPAFKGLHTHARALAAGVRIAGCTVHFVRPATDEGPIILQAAVPVLPDDTADALAARVLLAEHRCYPAAVRWIAEGRLRVVDGRVVIDGAAAAAAPLLNPAP